jgi:hypothetical protein
MEFVHAAKLLGLPKIVSIQNSYSLIVRCRFEGETDVIDLFTWFIQLFVMPLVLELTEICFYLSLQNQLYYVKLIQTVDKYFLTTNFFPAWLDITNKNRKGSLRLYSLRPMKLVLTLSKFKCI